MNIIFLKELLTIVWYLFLIFIMVFVIGSIIAQPFIKSKQEKRKDEIKEILLKTLKDESEKDIKK